MHKKFYELIREIGALPTQGIPLGEAATINRWTRRGVYFFLEPGETIDGENGAPRVVRVGTHAVSRGSRSTLGQRLRAHRGTLGGGGNHRGSIFRLHVGSAIRAKLGLDLPTWGKGSTAPRQTRDFERDHEQRVSEVIRSMPVLWVDVEDEAGPDSQRSVIERGSIALLSNLFSPLDAPSESWLGMHSPRDEIRRSGLWNLNYTHELPNPDFINVFSDAIERTARAGR